MKTEQKLRVFGVLVLSFACSVAARKCSSQLDGQLLLLDRGNLWKVGSSNDNREPLANISIGSTGLDYDLERGIAYWCSPQRREVLGLDDGATEPRVVVPHQENWLPIDLALDPVAGNLYIAEGFSDSVQIFDVADGGPAAYYRAVVIGTNVSELRGIALDPYEGYLFVLDRYQIFRTDLDGENDWPLYSEPGSVYDIVNELPTFFRNILDYGMMQQQRSSSDARKYKRALGITALTLDLEDRRVYWVNSARQRVEGVDYDGRGLRVLFEDRSAYRLDESPAALAFLGDQLFWANDAAEKVIRIDVDNGNLNEVILEHTKATSMRGVSCDTMRFRKVHDPCAEANCQQLCVRSRATENQARCTCGFGYQLASDNKSCESASAFLLYTQNQYLRGRILNSSQQGLVDVLNPTQLEVGSRAVLDYDAEDELLYFTSLYPGNKLHQAQLDASVSRPTVLMPDLLSRDVGQFAYDWSTRNLYYFTHYYADATMLGVTNARNPSFSKLLLQRVDGLIRAVVLHPVKGWLFYARLFDEESRAEIVRVAMDGSSHEPILRLDKLDTLDDLAIDYKNDRIYWSQSQRLKNNAWRARIRHSHLNGSDVQELDLPENLNRVDSLAVQGNHVYAILNGEWLGRLDKLIGGKPKRLIAGNESPGLLSGLKVFDRNLQADGHRPCANLDCERLCLLVPDLQGRGQSRPVCACPYGQKLHEDGKSCVDNREEEPPFVPCEYESFKCNKRTDMTIGTNRTRFLGEK